MDDFTKNCSTKIKTSFIGAISQFEENFGALWGHNKFDNELTENNKKFRVIWEKVRAAILSNGNNQIRKLEKESERYHIKYVGYHYDLKPMENNNV